MGLLEIVVFLFGLGFAEVVVKPLAITLFRGSFKLLPKIFDRLDPIMPESIAALTPAQLEKRIYDTINGAASEEGISLSDADKKRLFNEFLAQYNPITAASKVT